MAVGGLGAGGADHGGDGEGRSGETRCDSGAAGLQMLHRVLPSPDHRGLVDINEGAAALFPASFD